MRAHAHDAEHELAAMLQRSLLPRRLPELPGGTAVARYLPATPGLQVGGDWYDVIAAARRTTWPWSSATSRDTARPPRRSWARCAPPCAPTPWRATRPTWSSRTPTGSSLDLETDLFATCCYADVDMEEGNRLVVRAGHLAARRPPPGRLTEDAEAAGGPPLGVLAAGRVPDDGRSRLAPGTVLALVTDGLVESADLHMDEGMRRARAGAGRGRPRRPGRVADELLGDAGRREDDVALLLLRYDGMKTRPIRAGWTVWRLPDAVMHARRFTAAHPAPLGRPGGGRRRAAGRLRTRHQRPGAHPGTGPARPDPAR